MSKSKNYQSTLNIRCYKDNYGLKMQNQAVKSKLNKVQSNKILLNTKRSESRQQQIQKNRECGIQQLVVLKRKLKNVQFLQNCIYLQIDKLEAKQQYNNKKKAEANQIKYQQDVAQYEQLNQTIGYYQNQLKNKSQKIQQIKQGKLMLQADIQSQYHKKTQLLLQKQDYQQLLKAYHDQFQQQNRLIDIQMQLQEQLTNIQIQKQQIKNKLQILQIKQNQLNQLKNHTNHKYLQQKINQLRIQLFEKQQKINNTCKIHKVKNLRQLICAYYTSHHNSKSKTSQEGIQIWLCKNDLILQFQKYVKDKRLYQNKQLIKNFNLYIQTLIKIQTSIKKNQKNTQQDFFNKCQQEENQINLNLNQLKYQQNNILKQIDQIKAQYQQLFSEQKRLYIQSADTKNIRKVVQSITQQQNHRITNIKHIKIRLKQIKQLLINKNYIKQIQYLIKKQQNSLKYQISCLDGLKKQLGKIIKNRNKLVMSIQKFKKQNMSSSQTQQNREAITILYKKISKLEQNKKQIQKQVQNLQNSIIKKQNQSQNYLYSNYYTQNKTPFKKTTKNLKQHPLELTIKKLQNLKQSLRTDRTPATMMSKMVSY